LFAGSSVSRDTFLRFIKDAHGNVGIITGTSLPVNISMLVLCEILSQECFEKKEKIYAMFRGKDPNRDGLMRKKLSAVFNKMLSNEDVATRRLGVICGDEIIDVDNTVTVDSVVEVFDLSNKNWAKYLEYIGNAIETGVKNIFIFSEDFVLCGLIQEVYGMIQGSGVNVWFPSSIIPGHCLDVIFGDDLKGELDKLFILESKFIGMDDSGKNYVVRINLLDQYLATIVMGATFSL
jgi:hypothetical protein